MLRLLVLAVLAAIAGLLPGMSGAQADASEVSLVGNAVLATPQWVAEARTCPAELVARKEATDHLVANNCQPGKLATCLASCSAGTPGACYWLAQALQQQNAAPEAYEPLYQRACKLGVMSGCTNRAAGMLKDAKDDEGTLSCTASTFEAVCAFDDPWACTMHALHLSRGMGTRQDTRRALQVLEKSCKYGPQDEACRYAGRIRNDIRAREANGQR